MSLFCSYCDYYQKDPFGCNVPFLCIFLDWLLVEHKLQPITISRLCVWAVRCTGRTMGSVSAHPQAMVLCGSRTVQLSQKIKHTAKIGHYLAIYSCKFWLIIRFESLKQKKIVHSLNTRFSRRKPPLFVITGSDARPREKYCDYIYSDLVFRQSYRMVVF